MPDVDSTKLPYTEAHVKASVAEWAEFMQIDTPFEVQFGSFDGLPEELKATGDEFGVTIGYPEGNFIVCISDKCPPEKLEQVIVHELVHVHTFAQSGPDERDAMEVATELAAGLVIQLRASEQSFDEPTKDQINAAADVLVNEEVLEILNGYSGPEYRLRLDVVKHALQAARLQPMQQAFERIAEASDVERVARAIAQENNDDFDDYPGGCDSPYWNGALAAIHAMGIKIRGLVDCCNPGLCKGCPGCKGVVY